MKKRILSIMLCLLLSFETQMVWADENCQMEENNTQEMNAALYADENHDLPEEKSDSDAEKSDQEILKDSQEDDLGGADTVEAGNVNEAEVQDEKNSSGEEIPQSGKTDEALSDVVQEPSGNVPAQETEDKDVVVTAQKNVPNAEELKITPNQTISKGDTVTLTGKVSSEMDGAVYRYIYNDGNTWYEISSSDKVTSVEWCPETSGKLLVAFQVIYQGEESNAFQALVVGDRGETASISQFSVTRQDKGMWNDSLILQGAVKNPSGQALTYEYLVYDGEYWKLLSSSKTLDMAEFIPERSDINSYLLCFQIYNESNKVLAQSFFNYKPEQDYVSIENIVVDVKNDGDYYLDIESGTNDRYTEYRWIYYDLSTKKWMDIQDWSSEKTAVWHPVSGAYWIHAEARTSTGKTAEKTVGRVVEKFYVKLGSIQVERKDAYEFHLKVDAETNNNGTEYRWLYYDIAKGYWGLIQDWSSQQNAVWNMSVCGTYWIHVEGRTATGETEEKTIGYVIDKPKIELSDIKVDKKDSILNLDVNVDSDCGNIEYRWLYYNVTEGYWGTIQDWSASKTAVWSPPKSGTYWLHAEGRSSEGDMSEITVGYIVDPFKIDLNNIQVKKNRDKNFSLDVAVDTDDANAEYRWMYYELSTGCWGMIQDWSVRKEAAWEAPGFGSYWILAEGRTTGGETSQVIIGYGVEETYVRLGEMQVYTPDWSTYYIHQINETNDPSITYTYMIYDLKNKQWIGLPSGESTYWQPMVSGTYWIHAVITDCNGTEYTNTIGYTITFREFGNQAKTVMHNIIYAVETGGQIYGNAKYDTFCPAFNLTQKETAITIGAGGWFATEAQKLLKLIRTEDPVLFAELDTAGIGYDLDNCNWSIYGSDGNGNRTMERGSEKAVCIQKIISSEVGKKVQDRLVDEEMEDYVKKALNLGVTDLKARMFCANIHHLGGYGAMKRVIENCKSDGLSLTMDNLWISMRNHTSDLNGNGVGANKYKTRHQKVMQWLNQYI